MALKTAHRGASRGGSRAAKMVKVDEKDWTKHTVTKFEGVKSEFANPLEDVAKRKGGKAGKKGPVIRGQPENR
jgi:hypothetical protein